MAVTKKRQATRPSDLDDQMRQSLMDIRLLESSARVLQSRAISTLEGTKGKPGETETLVPIGSGSFVKAKLADAEKVIIGVGAGVCIEKPIEDSMKDLRLRSSELEKARATVTQQLNQVYGQTEDYRAHLNDLARKKGGGTVEIV